MPFGKFKGTALEELPADYVAWLAALEDLRDPLRRALLLELARRVMLGQPSGQDKAGTQWVLAEAAVSAPEIHAGDDPEVPF